MFSLFFLAMCIIALGWLVMQKNTISLQLAGKRFQVPCAESDAPDLLQAAEYVNNALKSSSRSQQVHLETRLLMLSLNLSYELLQSDRFNKQLESDISQALRHVQRLIEEEKDQKDDKDDKGDKDDKDEKDDTKAPLDCPC